MAHITRKTAAFPLLALLAQLSAPAWSQVSSGGNWELIRSLPGTAAGPVISGPGYESGQSLGESIGLHTALRGGTDILISGYLSQIPSASINPVVMQFTSSGAASAGGAVFVFAPTEPVILYFSNDMATSTLNAAVSVRAVMDAMANPLSSSATLTLAYGAAQSLAVTTVGPGWPKGMFFDLFISTAARDINGATLQAGGTYTFMIIRDHLASNVAIPRDMPLHRVAVPENAFSEDYFLALSTAVTTPEVAAANAKQRSLGSERRPTGLLQIDPYGVSGQPWSGTLAKNTVITVPYPDGDGDGRLDTNAAVRVKTLSMWRLQENASLWVQQSGTSRDAANRTVSLPSNHFSIYALIGKLDTDLSEVRAYPVPFRPNGGNPARYGTESEGITFTNLPSLGTIRIYSLSGRLVRSLDIMTNPQKWDTRNAGGQAVASGLYIWEVSVGENRKTGKLVIIR